MELLEFNSIYVCAKPGRWLNPSLKMAYGGGLTGRVKRSKAPYQKSSAEMRIYRLKATFCTLISPPSMFTSLTKINRFNS